MRAFCGWDEDYYNVPSEPPNSTYLSTLQRLRSWHTKAGLPFAYYQLDSWMYPKGSKGGMLEVRRPALMLARGSLPSLTAAPSRECVSRAHAVGCRPRRRPRWRLGGHRTGGRHASGCSLSVVEC